MINPGENTCSRWISTTRRSLASELRDAVITKVSELSNTDILNEVVGANVWSDQDEKHLLHQKKSMDSNFLIFSLSWYSTSSIAIKSNGNQYKFFFLKNSHDFFASSHDKFWRWFNHYHTANVVLVIHDLSGQVERIILHVLKILYSKPPKFNQREWAHFYSKSSAAFTIIKRQEWKKLT